MKSTIPATLALIAACGAAHAQCIPSWLPGPTGTYATSSYGTDMPVDASCAWLPPGQTVPRLVVAGRFHSIAGGTFSHIAVWDGTSWLQLGSGMNGNVQAVFDYNGTLVATGLFSSAGGVPVSNIASWNGSSWQAMGGLNDYGAALAMHSGFLFVGGNFTQASGVSANHLARWSGSAWQPVNAGTNGPVLALGNFSTPSTPVEGLIIGGEFTSANGMTASRIVGYNLDIGNPWYTFGIGVDSTVYAIKAGPGGLFVGGTFNHAGGLFTGGLARYDTLGWHTVGSSFFSGQVYALQSYFDSVRNAQQMVIGGLFAGDSPNIQQFDGTNFSPLGTGANASVFSLTTYNSSIIAGGAFTQAGPNFVQGLARWSGATGTTTATSGWSELKPAPSAPVRALLPTGPSFMYVGGDFTFTVDSGDTVGHLFGTDGTTPGIVTNCFGCGLANGTSGPVYALSNYITGTIVMPRNNLVIAGAFTQAGGFPASNIAEFSSLGGYTAFGTGTDGRVDAVIQYPPARGGHLIAAGEFNTAGGVSTRGVAQWTGSWSPLGSSGLAGGAAAGYAVADYNSLLILGGNFTSVNGVGASSIASWNGTSWQPLPGATLSGSVRAMTVFNGQLIAAGDFSSSSGTTLDRIGAWNGSAWTAMSAGLPLASSFSATSLAVHNGELYVGGFSPFTEGPGTPHSVYRWTGSAWTVVGGSPERPVYALASMGGSLWAGGDFGVASGQASPYLTQLKCACYANCDNSTSSPILNVNDYICFQAAFAAGSPYANCDNSTTTPILNVNDFICFQSLFAAGCP